LGVSSYPSVAPAGESDTVTWDAVPGATSYILYYTSDGSIPTLSSASITVTGANWYVHKNLDPTLYYTYAVQAVGHGRSGALSVYSWDVQPLPMIHATIDFNDYYNGNVGFMYFHVDGSSYTPISGTRKTVAGYTDYYGSATFDVTVDHDNYWGYSVFKDMDGSGTLNTGDTVWGNNTNPGYYGFSYWSSLITSSKNFTVSFENKFDSLPHQY
jgi:hypothetical protein